MLLRAESSNNEDTYCEVRASVPNEKIARAARFLDLNHTSFNGIYRVNLAGVYNVPFGQGRTAYIPTPDQLWEVSDRLKKATMRVGDFGRCLGASSRGISLLDPPYTVAHNHNGFIKYNRNKANSCADAGVVWKADPRKCPIGRPIRQFIGAARPPSAPTPALSGNRGIGAGLRARPARRVRKR